MRPAEVTKSPAPPTTLSIDALLLLRRFIAVIGLFSVVLAVDIIVTRRFGLRNLNTLILVCLMAGCYLELRGGRIQRGMGLLTWGMWVDVFMLALFVDGIRTPALFALPVLLMTTAWVHGRWAAISMALATALALGLLVGLEYAGWLPEPVRRTSLDLFLVYCFVTTLAAVLSISLAEGFRRLYATEQALRETLDARVQERTTQLSSANTSLTETVEQLERTRAILVQTEKLAALGSVVAGISHEISTPLGNARLVATARQDHLTQLDRDYRSGAMARSKIEKFLTDEGEGLELIVRSLERAATLVASFKQVAVDQTSERRRVFDLATIVSETIETLRPRYRAEPWEIVVDIDASIELDSYPGPLEQIVLNLVMNSIRHGFEGRTRGRISIVGRRMDLATGPGAELVIADDGAGIAAEHIERVFDPFFTTKLGQGGSGLGLNIAHRITTQLLRGRISVESVPDVRTAFTLQLPLRPAAPG